MSQGTARLGSQPVTVRAVGAEGRAIAQDDLRNQQAAREQAALAAQAAREQAAQAAREQAARDQAAREQAAREQAAREQAAREQAERERLEQNRWWRRAIAAAVAMPLQWFVVLALIAGGAIAGGIVLLQKRGKEPLQEQVPPEPTRDDPDGIDVPAIGLHLSSKVAIPSGTQQDRQRLRLYPIGRNDIGPFDLLFEKTLAVGRSPDSEICISNDGQLSASHCTLAPNGTTVLVQDAGSRNGTRVNGVPINGYLHAEPDSILGVGRTEMRMKLLAAGAR
jgi:FHA domain